YLITYPRIFRFGHNGGDDYWLLRNDDWSDRTIYEFDYYNEANIKSLGITFDDLLDQAPQNLTETRDGLIDNSKKVWSIQFSIDTTDVIEIINSLKKEFNCCLLKAIENTHVSSTGVISSEGTMQ